VQPHLYEWSTACGCWTGINGLADAVRIRLNMTALFLRPLETRSPVICGRNALRSSRKLFALDDQGG
jgi:hypothetical protein